MTPREAWILENLAPLAAARAGEREGRALDREGAFALFRDADPSRNASATAWLMGVYVKSGFLLEDLAGGASSKAAETLLLFGRHRGRLPADERSLTGYRRLADLHAAVAPFEETRLAADEAALLASATGRERRRLERDKARRESIVLREDEVCTVAVPLTVHASRWWGKGTQWCTAAERNNAFAQYAAAPLVVVTLAGGERFQFQAGANGTTAMDALDRPIDRAVVERHRDALVPIVLWAQETNGATSDLVPDDLLTEESWLRLLTSRRGDAMMAAYRMPEHLRTEETGMRVAELRPEIVVRLPRSMQTPAVLMAMVSRSGITLGHVPIEKRTPALCEAALAQNGEALQWVPPGLVTEATCLAAVRRNGWALKHVPDRFAGTAMWEAAVESCAAAIEFVPEGRRTRAMSRSALERNPFLLDIVPLRFLDRDAVVAAVRSHPHVVSMVPEAFRDEEIHAMALRMDGTLIDRVPERFRTAEMLALAVRAGCIPFRIPDHLKDAPGLVEELLAIDPGAMRVLSDGKRTREMCERAVAAKPSHIRLVPREMRDEAMFRILLRHRDGDAFLPRGMEHLLEREETPAAPVDPPLVLAWEPGALDGLRLRLAEAAIPAPSAGSPLLPSPVPVP